MKTFKGSEESFWHGFNPKRLDALLMALLPAEAPAAKPSLKRFLEGGA